MFGWFKILIQKVFFTEVLHLQGSCEKKLPWLLKNKISLSTNLLFMFVFPESNVCSMLRSNSVPALSHK